MNIKTRSVAVIIAAFTATLISSPVDAQEVRQTEKNKLVLEEITVTVRKKEENVMDVPLAITAFGTEEIEAAGLDSLDDVAAMTPGLTFSNLYGEFLAVPVIRGIAPTAIFRENNAAVFIDGVFVSGREGLNASQLDLERIEIVKGPQSTKYGRNAFSGAINYVSARPTEEFQGKAEFKVGDYEKRAARISLSGPLVGDVLLGRVAAQIDEWSGSYDNNLSRVDIGGYQYKNMQVGLWYTPTDTLNIQWFLYLTDDEIDQSPLHSLAHNCEDRMDLPDVEDPDNPGQMIPNPEATATPRPQNFCGTIPRLSDNMMGISEGAVGEERELVRTSFRADWEPAFGTFTLLSGFSTTEQSAITDGARNPGFVPFVYLGTNGPSSFLGEMLEVSPGDEVEEFSWELRFDSSSAQEGAFGYDVGISGYSVETKGRATDVFARVTGENGARLPDDWDFLNGGFDPCCVIGDAIWMPWFSQTVDEIDPRVFVTEETDSWSVFGSVTLDIGDRWTIGAGARYTDDDKTIDEVTGTNAEDSWDYWTGRGDVTFNVTDDINIYASVANGKKSGGFDIIEVDLIPPGQPIIPDVIRVFTYDIEKITMFELGSKGTLWEGRARYDLSMFYSDWTDILIPQVREVDPETGWPFDQPTGVDQTGGDATVLGAEAELKLVVSENLTIDLRGSWTDSEFDEAALASYRRLPSFWEDTNGDGIGDKGDISGQDVLRQSEWTGAFTADYRRPVYEDWDGYVRSDITYQSSQWVGAANQARIPGRTIVNLRLGLDSEHYQLEFWIRNLFDDDKPVSAFRDVFFNNTHTGEGRGTTDDLFPFRMTVRYPNLRTMGLTGRIRF